MNISSVVIMCLPENEKSVIEAISNCDFCEYHLHQNGKIIVTIEGEDTNEEVKKIRQIEKLPNVISAAMHFTYCEDELEAEKEKLKNDSEFPAWLNDENIKAKDIPYNGNLKNKLF